MKRKGIQIAAGFFAAFYIFSTYCVCGSSSFAMEERAESGDAQDEDGTSNEDYAVGGGYAVTGQLEGAGYATQLYDATNGLPTPDANCILGAKDGAVWIGGYSGVIRYDGTSFELIDSVVGLTSARAIFEDRRGRIWIGTNDNGVIILDNSKAITLSYLDGLPSTSIRCFAEDNLGNVYIGTTAGVCYADRNMDIHIVDDERINSERVLKLQADSEGLVYGHTKDGKIFSISDGNIKELYTSEDLGINLITTFLVDPVSQGKVYIGTDTYVIYHGIFGKNAEELDYISIYPVMSSHWISYDCNRVWVSSTVSAGYVDYNDHFHYLNKLPMNSAIEMMTSDYQGNIWMASTTQGVMKIVTSSFKDLNKDYDFPNTVANTTCYHRGRLYIGTDKGLQILNANMRSVGNRLTETIGDGRVRDFATDSKGNLWISVFTNDTGLVCFTPDEKIITYTTADGLPSNKIRETKAAQDGSIIVGTDDGLAIIKDDKVVKTYGVEEGLYNSVCLDVDEGFNGEIYVGTDGGGIYIINGSDVKKLSRDEGLTSDVILEIKKDNKRELYWIITSNSIEYLDKDGKITNVDTFEGNNYYDMVQDDNGDMWIMSSYGIFRVSTEDLINNTIDDYKLYNVSNGLPSVPTSYSRSCINDKGIVFIATRTGVASIDTNNYYSEGQYARWA